MVTMFGEEQYSRLLRRRQQSESRTKRPPRFVLGASGTSGLKKIYKSTSLISGYLFTSAKANLPTGTDAMQAACWLLQRQDRARR